MAIVSFNGKTYNSLEEMPVDQRAAYEQVMAFMKDENNNGIPDMFEGDVIQKMIGLASSNMRVLVNGQEVDGLQSMSPEAREKFNAAMEKLGQLGILPQAASGMQGNSFQSVGRVPQVEPAFPKSPPFIQSTSSAISEDSGSRNVVILLAVLAFVGVCVLVAAAGFFFLNR
jgi:hypothetical protein